MSKNSFISYLAEIIPLSASLKKSLVNRLEEERYKPHQILFSPGQLENRLCFIESGFARNYYYDEDGNEHTVKFWEPNDILLSYQGYWGQPAYFYTELMEETVLVSLKYDALHALLVEFPEAPFLVKTILNQFHNEENKKQKLATLTAEQRLRQMRKHNRLVFQKVPLKIIASYLNMSRETLSRMISKE
jgi:CRP-like cAMP-binding protein